MINLTLYKRELRRSLKLLAFFLAVITLYVGMIITMYNPEMMEMMETFREMMPELMAAVGMDKSDNTLIGFMISYLYGFILLVFPMVFTVIRGNGLVASYVDRGSMASLVAAPVKRRTVVFTQMTVLISCILALMVYVTALELVVAEICFPGELDMAELLAINCGLTCLQLLIGGISFLASCLFSDTRHSIAFGAGLPGLMYVLQMLANVGEEAEIAKYFSLFTLYDPTGILAGDATAILGSGILLTAAVALYILANVIFCKKDLHI